VSTERCEALLTGYSAGRGFAVSTTMDSQDRSHRAAPDKAVGDTAASGRNAKQFENLPPSSSRDRELPELRSRLLRMIVSNERKRRDQDPSQ
jgi:hypothetical protein